MPRMKLRHNNSEVLYFMIALLFENIVSILIIITLMIKAMARIFFRSSFNPL